MYYYESPINGVYMSETTKETEDNLIGDFDVFEDFIAFFADEISINNKNGYDLQMLIDNLSPGYNYNLAADIIKRCKNMAKAERNFVAGRHK